MLTARPVSLPSDAVAQLTAVIQDATPEQCPALMGQLEALKASLWLKMTRGAPGASVQEDRLLTAEEVAGRLQLSTDYVYRHAHQFPFLIREGRKVRFSQLGLDRYLKQRQGR